MSIAEAASLSLDTSPSEAAAASGTHLLWQYDVFLSFRGEDTRMNFVDHLYAALFDKGIYTYKDDITLPRGEYINQTLLTAIEKSRFAVVVFSKKYADSSFCLTELVKILESRKERGQIVLPVFYKVDASEVRHQTGDFGEGFAKYKKDSRVNAWKQALVEAASISGWGSDGFEHKKIKEIIETISLGLPSINSAVDKNLIGIGPRMQYVKSLMKIGSGGVRVIGIWGIGGGGKTTLATAIYNDVSCEFGGRCSFVESIKEDTRKYYLRELQEKILADVLKERDMKLGSTDEGKRMIKKRMCHFSVLIVLDDVNHISQLEALAGAHDWFGEGSQIIITTRDKCLLESHGVDSIHEVNLLKDWEAIHLFNRYAFPKIGPSKEFEELSLNVVRYADGLPLALKVLGSFLCKKRAKTWKSALDRLKVLPNTEICEVLKISYDGLQPDEKEIFLDVACFFRNREKDEVMEILDACEFSTVIVLEILIGKSLISVSHGKIQMHDLIQEMGRSIVLNKRPTKRSRIWQAEQLLNIHNGYTPMEKKAIVAKKIKGIKVRLDDECAIDFSDAFTNTMDLRFLDISIFPVWKDRPDDKEPNVLPKNLRWLSWLNYPGKSLSPAFQAMELVAMRITCSKIVQLWEDNKSIGPMPNLKILDLSGSKYLIKISSFSYFPNLERLRLQGCRKLKAISPSIGYLESLVFLDMSCCSNLKIFPPIVRMTSLEVLILSGCTKLRNFPEIQGKMVSLKHLSLRYSRIKELPDTIGSVSSLVSIDLSDCNCLKRLPLSFHQLKCLRSLKLSGCSNLVDLPADMVDMECLEEFVLDYTGVRELPNLHLKNLKTLSFKH